MSAFAGRDVMPRARRAHSRSGADAGLSFTQRVVAELAPYTPLLPCCRRSLVEGLALVTTTPGAIATTRPVAVRAAMQALHADGIPAHVSRVTAARRTQYLVVGVDAPSAAAAVGALVLQEEPPSRRVSRRGPAGASRRRAVPRDRLHRGDGRGPARRRFRRARRPGAEPAAARALGGHGAVGSRCRSGAELDRRAGRPSRLRVRPGDTRGAQRREPPPQRRDRQPAPDCGSRGSSARVDRGARGRTRCAGRRCRPRSARPPSSGPSTPTTTSRSWRSWPAAAGRRWPGACTAWSPRRVRAVIGWKCLSAGAESTVTGGCPAWE